jgi:hypothetical protein
MELQMMREQTKAEVTEVLRKKVEEIAAIEKEKQELIEAEKKAKQEAEAQHAIAAELLEEHRALLQHKTDLINEKQTQLEMSERVKNNVVQERDELIRKSMGMAGGGSPMTTAGVVTAAGTLSPTAAGITTSPTASTGTTHQPGSPSQLLANLKAGQPITENDLDAEEEKLNAEKFKAKADLAKKQAELNAAHANFEAEKDQLADQHKEAKKEAVLDAVQEEQDKIRASEWMFRNKAVKTEKELEGKIGNLLLNSH